jgi:hypothetical protein
MAVYFSRAGGGQHNCSPVIQVLTSFGSGVEAINSDGKKANPNNWKDIATITVIKESNNSVIHLSINGWSSSSIDGNTKGSAGIRLAKDSGSGDADSASDVIDLGVGQQALDGYDDMDIFTHSLTDDETSGTVRYRLQLQCNAPDNEDDSPSANATGFMEVMESEQF